MGKIVSRCTSVLAVCSLLLGATAVQAGTIFGSKHDLSLGNTFQVCGYCHVPHNASTQTGLAEAPLWNRRITNLNAFTPYTSPTMTETCPTRPSGISLACLSCHDGAGASSAVTSSDQHNLINPGVSGGGMPVVNSVCMRCHTGGTFSVALTVMGGPDLSNDHPISMQYPMANANFVIPPDAVKGWGDVKLFNGKVECPTCHNVHDPTNAPFLRTSNSGSNLCLRCHSK
jgi:predicted CXXCH cytochrome family protein